METFKHLNLTFLHNLRILTLQWHPKLFSYALIILFLVIQREFSHEKPSCISNKEDCDVVLLVKEHSRDDAKLRSFV